MDVYDNMISNVIVHIKPWWGYIRVMMYLSGLTCVVMSLVHFPKAKLIGTFHRCVLGLVAGVCLLNTPVFLDSLAYTVFNDPSANPMSYAAPKHYGKVYVDFAVYVIGIIGLIGIARGILIFRRMDITNHEMGRALLHLLGGIICVNLPAFLRIMGTSLGGEVASTVNIIIGN